MLITLLGVCILLFCYLFCPCSFYILGCRKDPHHTPRSIDKFDASFGNDFVLKQFSSSTGYFPKNFNVSQNFYSIQNSLLFQTNFLSSPIDLFLSMDLKKILDFVVDEKICSGTSHFTFSPNSKFYKTTVSDQHLLFKESIPPLFYMTNSGWRWVDGCGLSDGRTTLKCLAPYVLFILYFFIRNSNCKLRPLYRGRKYGPKLAYCRMVVYRERFLRQSAGLSLLFSLYLLLLLSGDVHPNPGPLPRHYRHPNAESLIVGSWNVRTLLPKKRSHLRPTAIVAQVLDSHKIDICALSETRFFGERVITEVGGGYTFFLKGLPEDSGRQIHGVGIAIRTKLIPELNGNLPVGINERLMTMTLPTLRGKMHIISAYAPTASSEDCIKDQFYDELDQLLKNIPSCDKVVVLGDFNARVGADHGSWIGVLGKHGVDAENASGTALLSFCTRHDLIITNTLYQQPDRFKYTWMHPGTKKWHMLDYAITRQRDVKDILHTRAMCGTCNWTDHRLVKCKLAIRTRKPIRHHHLKPHGKLNVSRLKSIEVRNLLSGKFSEVFESTDILGENSEATLENLTRITLQVSREILGRPERKHRDWFDENDQIIKPLLQELHDLRIRVIEDKHNVTLAESYRTKKQEVQERLRLMENAWWQARAHEIQLAADKRDYKTLYQGLKAVYGPRHTTYPSVKSKDGKTVITDPAKILDRWVEHFDGVLNQASDFDRSVLNDIPQWEINTGLADPPTLKEVEDSIKQLTSGKAAGPDGVPPDIYKHGGPALKRQLLVLFTQCWEEGKVPQAFKDANLMHLYKNKGDVKCCDNHRGISLLCIAGKIYARMLLNRLVKHLDAIGLIPESQCGFVAGRSTIDPCFALRQLQEKCWFHNRNLYLLFVDLTKAFDTVNREGLWALLRKIGCPDHFVQIIRSFHDEMKITVMEGSDKAPPFVVSSGTKQGCVLAPTLFSVFFSLMLLVAFRNTDEGVEIVSRFDRGLCRTNNQHFKAPTKVESKVVRDLLFADDCALASSSEEGLQQLCDSFASAARRFGLIISIDKTESMHQAPPGVAYRAPRITVEGKPLKAVKTFKYLGSLVSNDNSLDAEIDARLSKANSAYNALTKRLWRKNGIRVGTKISVYKAAVLSSLLYGSEAWTLTKKNVRKLEKFHLTCLRKIAGIKWFHKVPNFKVLERCHMSSVSSMLDLNKLRWIGHVIRMDDNRIPKQMLYSRLAHGSSHQGNHLTYINSLRKTLKACNIYSDDLEAKAGNRNAWRHAILDGIQISEKDVQKGLKEKYLHSREIRHARQCRS